MSTQATYYPADPLDSSIAPDQLFMGNGFSPEFLPLSLLEKEGSQDMQMEPMGFQPTEPNTIPAGAPTSQSETDDMNRRRLRNRALRPAPSDSRKESMEMEMEMNPGPAYLHAYPSMPGFSSFPYPGPADPDPDYRFEHDNISPHSDFGSNNSSPLRWHNGDEKRAKHLERNRAAASKSRQKKKRETDLLRNVFQQVSRRRSDLEEEVKDLHSQLLSLKDEILLHSRCDDNAIHTYFSRMVQQAANKHDSVSSASSGPSATTGTTASTHEDEDTDRARQLSGSISPLSHPVRRRSNPGDMTLTTPQVPVRMGEASGLPCGVEKPMMNEMFPQNENIFDLQISIS